MTRLIKVNLECAADLEAEREFHTQLDREFPKPTAPSDMWTTLSTELYEQQQRVQAREVRRLEEPIIPLIIPSKVEELREMRRLEEPIIRLVIPDEVEKREGIPIVAPVIPRIVASEVPRSKRPRIGEIERIVDANMSDST